MVITASTRLHDIIRTYGDVSPIMKAQGIRCDGPRWLRRLVLPIASRILTVERAARMHKVPLDTMLRAFEVAQRERSGQQRPA